MNRPNLFKYATSELSQDAFLCWFAAWAAPEYAQVEPALHEAAREFIKQCYARHGKTAPVIQTIEPIRQKHRLDVTLEINNNEAILIEDKTYSNESASQLSDYRTAFENEKCDNGKLRYDTLIFIYYKTLEQGDLQVVNESGFMLFDRKDMLQILKPVVASANANEIAVSYYFHLYELHASVRSYMHTAPDKWTYNHWIGFYADLQQVIPNSSFGYVPLAGFAGFWWPAESEARFYLQLEQERLCFKVSTPDPKDRPHYRLTWRQNFETAAISHNFDMDSSLRFTRTGLTMTAARHRGDYRVFQGENLDWDNTLQKLKSAQIVFEEALRSAGIDFKTTV